MITYDECVGANTQTLCGYIYLNIYQLMYVLKVSHKEELVQN